MLFVIVDAVDVALNTLSHVALLPDVVPVFTLIVLASVDDLQHVFGWVFLVTALAGTITLKII